MPLTDNRSTFTFNHTGQPDEYGVSTGNYETVQAAFDSRAVENLTDINNIKDTLRDEYDSSADITTNRKLSATGNFTGTLNGMEITEVEPGLSSAFNTHKAEKANHRLNILDYNCPIDGTTNILTALQAALNAAAAVCGEVFIPPTANGYTLVVTDTTVTIPSGVTLYGVAGSYNSTYVDISRGSVLKITGNEGTATGTPVFTMQYGSRIKELNFVWPNQTPTNPPVAYPYLIKGQSDCIVEDLYLHNCFQFADFTAAHYRATIRRIKGDIYKTGVNIDISWDCDHIENIHFWPFSSTDVALYTYKAANAKGIILGQCDGLQGRDIFMYGIGVGLEIGTNSEGHGSYGQINNLALENCKYGVYTKNYLRETGFVINGFKHAMSPTKQTEWSITASYSFVLNHVPYTTYESYLVVNDVNVWGGPDAFIYASATNTGFSKFTNVVIDDVEGTQLITNSGTGKIIVADLHCSLNKTLVAYGAGATSVIFENPDLVNEASSGTQKSVIKKYNVWDAAVVDVASATTTTLPNNGDFFNITGTTTITSVAASRPGRMVTLKFADILTFTDGSNLKIAGNFTTSADDTITLRCDGTNWYEVCRSVN